MQFLQPHATHPVVLPLSRDLAWGHVDEDFRSSKRETILLPSQFPQQEVGKNYVKWISWPSSRSVLRYGGVPIGLGNHFYCYIYSSNPKEEKRLEIKSLPTSKDYCLDFFAPQLLLNFAYSSGYEKFINDSNNHSKEQDISNKNSDSTQHSIVPS
ncbi:hypothetical protein CEXT_57401 [Caerostris extrusa]|uniref:Uncharacterized protein n=1 Tax=Caerostris extrusa TaxID=172846 RepID=A0AAV4XHJ0_CAEEX|nr:hypothetical protein CEXT_57401 [Caerostris extrusa]